MMTGKHLTIAIAAMAIALFHPQESLAQGFTGEQFLKWERKAQDYYFRTAIGMAGLIARQNIKQQGRCIDNWYFKNSEKAGDEILQIIKKFREYHPRGVILAVLEKKCGTLIY